MDYIQIAVTAGLSFLLIMSTQTAIRSHKETTQITEKYFDLLREMTGWMEQAANLRAELGELRDSHQYAVDQERRAREALQLVWTRWHSGEPSPPGELVPAVDALLASRPKELPELDPYYRAIGVDDSGWYAHEQT